jgi:hypothetical protein
MRESEMRRILYRVGAIMIAASVPLALAIAPASASSTIARPGPALSAHRELPRAVVPPPGGGGWELQGWYVSDTSCNFWGWIGEITGAWDYYECVWVNGFNDNNGDWLYAI